MKASIRQKLDTLAERLEEINALLSDSETIADNNKFRELSKEYARLNPIIVVFNNYRAALNDLESAEEMLNEDDAEMREMAEEEVKSAKKQIESLDDELQILLLPSDPLDENNVFIEIRAGAGGDEAALFAGALFRMYSRFVERQGWKLEIVNEHEGEHGGYKEIVSRILGKDVYSVMKFESGGHRVQRVPETESQGRVHTSACTVAIMPEIADVEQIKINPADLKVDTFRASGAGGQHVNKTDSAIRITHLPTGTVVECQDQRSQHKNRAQAMSLLQSRLLTAETDKQNSQQAEQRRNLIGSGDRSERIRTYNFPQGRLTDHRINLTLYKLQEILEGDLTQVIEPLRHEYQADLLAAMGD